MSGAQVGQLDTVADIVRRFDLTSLQPALRASEALADTDTPLDVAVLGQFKSGKSSLLNAVLGEAVFRVGAVPVTAVVTRAAAGPERMVRLTYQDGSADEGAGQGDRLPRGPAGAGERGRAADRVTGHPKNNCTSGAVALWWEPTRHCPGSPRRLAGQRRLCPTTPIEDAPMKRRKVSRRGFLRSALAGAAGASAAGALPAQGAEPEPQPKPPPKYSDYLKEKGTAGDTLPVTENNIEGPFYRPGAPFRNKLSESTDKGDVLVISGTVVNRKGEPIANATLDVWHASAFGRYDNDDPKHPPSEKEFRFRGKLKTDKEGLFQLETVRPGHYVLSPEQFRTAHVHFRVTADKYETLTSQFFFSDEPYNKSDAWFKPSMVLDLKPDAGKFVASVKIVLATA
jgi:protocatechuate 3,4-dioxygenase beta subunit